MDSTIFSIAMWMSLLIILDMVVMLDPANSARRSIVDYQC